MLVEDDNNLREIYGERLLAEGYEIVSANDGEEALALAVKEKPDLIISDVMMPKISGFDMLDILRQTPETRNTKVIMMTALSQMDDKDRADKLGADKYLVKSQVTLEDVARVVHDMIHGPEAPTETPTNTEAEATPAVAPVTAAAVEAPVAPEAAVTVETPIADTAPVAETPTPSSQPVINPISGTPADGSAITAPSAGADSATTTENEQAEVSGQIESFLNTPDTTEPTHTEPMLEPSPDAKPLADEPKSEPAVVSAPPVSEPQAANIPRTMDENVPDAPSARKKVIEPINDPTGQPNINELYEKEMAEEAANTPVVNPNVGAVVDSAAPVSSNPIVGPTPTAEPAPLEQIDATQIPGVTDENMANSAQPSEPTPQVTPENPGTPLPDQETQEKPDPNNPTQFAL